MSQLFTELTLSVNPSYFCNFRCSFCYLSKEQLADSKKISEDRLAELLSSVTQYFKIGHIDLYGGEITALPSDYLRSIFKIMRFYFSGRINLITNLSVDSEIYADPNIDLTVSWDFYAREQHEQVYRRMLGIRKPLHILTLVSQRLVQMSESDLDLFVEKLNCIPTLESFELKPFSQNHPSRQKVTHREFEEFVLKVMSRRNKFKFEFINELKIQDCLDRKYRSWSDNHLYITPSGSFAVLDFDSEGREGFTPLYSIDDYLQWSQREKQMVKQNPICSKCEYLGHCLSEHLQDVKSLENSCSGFVNLLNWGKSERTREL